MAEARDLFRNSETTEFVIVTIPTVRDARGREVVWRLDGYSSWAPTIMVITHHVQPIPYRLLTLSLCFSSTPPSDPLPLFLLLLPCR